MAAVEFAQVSKVFPNGFIGLENVSFRIEPKTLTYLVGESGAGKTTLMRLLIRELKPTEGNILVDGESILELPDKAIPQLRRRVAVVFQDYKLIADRTVAENVALALEIAGMPTREIEPQVREVLELVGLADRADMFPNQLSGGELQRVAIARSLVMSPQVLFADEPTGNLDPQTSLVIGGILKKIADLGTTVIVATHDQTLLTSFPGEEIHVHKGKIVKEPHAEPPEPEKKSSRHKKKEAE
jgi:cell division transport system ATP-binding protein